jgi:N-acetyl-anhydromuramyl-L-alanine amidase AmpD
MIIVQKPSSNHNALIVSPRFICLHWTGGKFESAVNWLTNPEAQVSSHFVISIDGEYITQLVQLNQRAWHCGGSFHPEMLPDTNSDSIGIEIEGPPSMVNLKAWPASLVSALANLCGHIKQGAPQVKGIVDHATINPKQKIDVKGGKGIDFFPWKELMDKVQKLAIADYTIPKYSDAIRAHFGLK